MKRIINAAALLAVFLALGATAQASIRPSIPDAGSTSLLLGMAAVGLRFVSKRLR